VFLELIDFLVGLFQLFEQLQRCLVGIIYFFFEVVDVVTCLKQLLLQRGLLLGLKSSQFLSIHKLLLDILQHS
jgi:hypothetical protein